MYFDYYGIVLTFALDSLQPPQWDFQKSRCVLTCTILLWMEHRPYPLPDHHPSLILKPRSMKADVGRFCRWVNWWMSYYMNANLPTSSNTHNDNGHLMMPPMATSCRAIGTHCAKTTLAWTMVSSTRVSLPLW